MTRVGLISAILLSALPMIAAEIPRPAPELAIALPDGKQLRVTDYRGKAVILTFILTT
jgi:hypothetical protein